MARPREEWLQDCGARYRALEQFSQEDARLQFLRILRSLPYGQYCTFSREYFIRMIHISRTNTETSGYTQRWGIIHPYYPYE